MQSITQLESRSEFYSSGLCYLRPSPRLAATFAPPTALEGERHGGFFRAPGDPGPVHVACKVAGAAAVPEESPVHFQCTYGGLLHGVRVGPTGRLAPGDRAGCTEKVSGGGGGGGGGPTVGGAPPGGSREEIR